MIVATVEINARELRKLEDIGAKSMVALRDEIRRLTIELQNKVKQEKLNGAVLNRRTGTLMRSIDQRVEETATSIAGYVGTNLRYGIAHELGFSGSVTVPAHARTIVQAFGKSITPTVVSVRPHTRNVNMPMRSFLKTSLSEFRGTIRDRLIAALKGVK